MANKHGGGRVTVATTIVMTRAQWISMATGDGDAAKAIRSALGITDGDHNESVTLEVSEEKGKIQYKPFYGLSAPQVVEPSEKPKSRSRKKVTA